MDPKLLVSTFVAVFLAELGDKTQLAAFSLAAGSGSRWSVFVGASLALVVATALAVLFGDLVTRVISPVWLRRGAGVLFIVMGIFFLVRGPEESSPPPDPADESAPAPPADS